jgi:EF hand
MRRGREVGKLLALSTAVAVVVATASQVIAVPIGQGVGTRIKYPTPFGANRGGIGATGRGLGSQSVTNDAILRQFDTNGNGRIDTAERKAMQSAAAQLRTGGADLSKAQLLQQFDVNGNGRLDPDELKSAKSALSASSPLGLQGLSGNRVRYGPQSGFGQQGIGQQGIGQPGFGGAAAPAGAKAAGNRPFGNARRQTILQEFDANGDGTIDARERIATIKARNEQRRQEAEQKKLDAKAGVKANTKVSPRVGVKPGAN